MAVAVVASLAVGPGSAAGPTSDSYLSPVAPMRALETARIPPEPWLAGHRGLDLAANVGDPVVAPASGVVTFAGLVVDRGVVTVTHDDGRRSSMEPVDATVAVGARVERGEEIGSVGAEPGHCGSATCVHWGVREGDTYIDPLDVLEGFGPIRLLPRSAGVAFRRTLRYGRGTRAASSPLPSESGTRATR